MKNDFLFRHLRVALLALALFPLGGAAAQVLPAGSSTVKNTVRLDGAGPFFLTLGYNIFRQDTHVVLPILLGYERQLGPRISGNLEVLLNGGTPHDERTGLAIQGRYYVIQRRRLAMTGLYVAPTGSYRAVRRDDRYDPAGLDKVAGVGLLAGGQFPVGASQHFVFDVAAGAMKWTLLSEDIAYRTHTYYPQQALLFDGRLSLGYRF